jgi:Family of unknown function (DUF5641)
MSENPRDYRVLTPGHFLVGRPLVSMPQRDYQNVPAPRLDKWQGLQRVQRDFWNQWYRDYLTQLQRRPRGFREITEIEVDKFVLLKDDNLPPMQWMKGRIERLFRGPDGVVRNVEVRTRNGMKLRHVKYLVFLPMENALRAGEDVRDDDNLDDSENE